MATLLLGLSLGFAAGISPGPLLTLVISATLERGFGAGLRVALAPILTDAPVIVLAVLVLGRVPDAFAAAVTLLGGGFVLYLGVDTVWRARRAPVDAGEPSGSAVDLWRGALVNVLSPHPWLFWVTVGGPLLVTAWRRHPLHAAAFLAAFYALIIGTKVVIAWLTSRGRRLLDGVWYRRLVAASGILLIVLATLLLGQGVAAL